MLPKIQFQYFLISGLFLMSFHACIPRHELTVEPSRSHWSEQQLFDKPFARRLIVPRQGSSQLKRKQSTVKVGSSELKGNQSTVGAEFTQQWWF